MCARCMLVMRSAVVGQYCNRAQLQEHASMLYRCLEYVARILLVSCLLHTFSSSLACYLCLCLIHLPCMDCCRAAPESLSFNNVSLLLPAPEFDTIKDAAAASDSFDIGRKGNARFCCVTEASPLICNP